MIFDEIRRRWPHLGLALYAIEPHGPVVAEVFATDGTTYSQQGATAEAALAGLFPEVMEQPHVVSPGTREESVFD